MSVKTMVSGDMPNPYPHYDLPKTIAQLQTKGTVEVVSYVDMDVMDGLWETMYILYVQMGSFNAAGVYSMQMLSCGNAATYIQVYIQNGVDKYKLIE